MYPLFALLFINDKWISAAFKLKKFWSWLLRVFLFMPIYVERKEALPRDQAYIVCPNHSSYIDIIMMFGVLPDRFLFMGKSEILGWPLFGLIFRKMNIAVNRDSGRSGLNALDEAAKVLDEGLRVVIFAEGGIPDDAPAMGAFKNGAFKLAIEKQIPILPVTFLTNWKRMSELEKLWGRSQPGPVRAVTHQLIHTNGMTQADLVSLRQRVWDTINNERMEYENRRQHRR